MPEFRDAARRLVTARTGEQAARLDLHRNRERLARLQQGLSALQRQFDAGDEEHRARRRALEDAAAELRDRIARDAERIAGLAAGAAASAQVFEPFTDPRRGLAQLDASLPTLLFPVRLETRFAGAGQNGGAQLWVRVYPDDCLIDTFEPTLSEAELRRVREFWIAWASAGGIEAQERGAWRLLAGQFGSGRAAWLIDQHRPRNLEVLPTKASEDDVLLVVAPDVPLPAAEVAPTATYWRAAWLAGDDRAAQDDARAALVAAVGEQRAGEIIAGYRPVNFRLAPHDPGTQVAVAFLELPDPATVPTQRLAWSQPAVVTALPERFVLLGFRDGSQVLDQLGAPIPSPLVVGLNPLADPQDQMRPDGSDLEFGTDLRYLADFDEAVRIGMGFRVDLSADDARDGFDQLMVLGVRLSADHDEGSELAQNLFLHHQQSAVGFGLLRTGAATNNTEGGSAAYGAAQDPDAAFDLTFGRLPPLTRTGDYLARLDSQWLADALGLPLGTFEMTTNSRSTDMGEARAMNTVLWPATWGYFMESMMRPVLDQSTVDMTRWFFTHFVTGRGLAPAVRIGDQPYGILPVTTYSRMAWLTDDDWSPPHGLPHPENFRAFLARLPALFAELRADWQRMSGAVAYVGKSGDPHQILLDVVGLSPSSVEYHRRWAESLEQLANRLKLEGFVGALIAAMIAYDYTQSGMTLLRRLGYGGTDVPEILEKFFLDAAKPITGDIVDDRPLSETEPIRAWTPEGDNYIGWLIAAAGTSFERLRTQEGFLDGEPPRALLYLLLRYALEQGYWDAGLRILGDAGELSEADVLTARIDPSFVHVTEQSGSEVLRTAAPARAPAAGWPVSNKPIHFDRRSESRYEYLYRAAPGAPDLLVAELIPSLLGEAAGTRYLSAQLDGLRHLRDAPTARLERVLAEHLDLASYRLDAWRWGLLHYQLAVLREGQHTESGVRTGLYVGAYGWLENVRREERTLTPVRLPPDLDADFNPPGSPPAMRDSANQGFMHAPSLNHAVAAAVLRNGYVSNLSSVASSDALAVDLSSARVRTALSVLDGMRSGQSLGALLGYRLERGLHDRHAVAEVDRFIYALRTEFPLVANRLTDTKAPRQPIQAVEARNVVDGLGLVTHIRESGAAAYPFGRALPQADAAQAAAIDTEVQRLLDVHDALADLATGEAVYQAVLGNYERTAATLDAFGKGSQPPEPEVIQTPRRGISLTHRVALHLEAGRDGAVSPNAVPVTARVLAEPAVNAWLAVVLPPPDRVACMVDHAEPGAAPQPIPVSQQDLGLQPLDLLYLLDVTGVDQAMTGLDDRIADHVIRTAGLRPDAEVSIRYRDAVGDTYSFFEVGALVRSLRGLVLRSRPLTPADAALSDEAPDAPSSTVDPQRIEAPLDRLRRVVQGGAGDDLTKLTADMAPLLADVPANAAAIAAQAEGWSARYVALARGAADFGIPQAAIGAVIDARRQAYRAALGVLDDVLRRWQRRIDDYAAAVAAAQGLPTDEHFAALRRAERLVTTEFTVLNPPTPAAYEGLLNGKRDAFAAKRNDLAGIRQAPAGTTAGVLAAISAELPVDRFDSAGIDLSSPSALLVGLAVQVRSLTAALATEATRRTAAAQTMLTDAAAAANPATAAELRVAAAKALFGDEFVLVPEYALAPERAAELANAWTDRERLLRHLTGPTPGGLGIDFPVDDWLYGVARVREKLGLWEHVLVTAEALRTAPPELTPLQLPYRPDDVWLGLRFPDDYRHDGERLAYTAHFAVPFDKAARQCGLLIDEWTEVVPAVDETTGVVFHYDRPNTEPPQAMLLALSPRMSGGWQWPDLVDAVRETFAEARLRAVEPAQVDGEPYAQFLPAAIMAATHHPITIGVNLAMNAAALEARDG
jgi:hypothetical protein